MAFLKMSERELRRLEVLRDLDGHRLTTEAACQLLGLSRRQLFRILRSYRLSGPAGLVSVKRGRPSNRRTSPEIRTSALRIIRERYKDFGATLAAEKLAERHDIVVSRETLRQWMIADGLWLDRKRRLKRAHQPRYRRDCVGELVQADGSDHRWFEDRGPMCSLLVFVDDATSRLMHLRFVESESTFSYFAATRAYLETYGKPVAFYTDKLGVFRVNKSDAASGNGLTQFGRAMYELNIDLICANSSQAKGRVERANKTLQDRLVKELRLAGISSISAGNAFLPGFMADYNSRFAKAPANQKDLHRPLSALDDLDEAFSWRNQRLVSRALTVHYDRLAYLLDQTPRALAAAGKYVEVVEYPEGRIAIRFEGADLPYRLFDKERRVRQADIVDNKLLGPLLAVIRDQQQRRDANRTPRKSKRPVRHQSAS